MENKILGESNIDGLYILKQIEFGDENDRHEIESAFTLDGHYIGNQQTAERLTRKMGIKPEPFPEEFQHNGSERGTCCIGYCEKEQKWYGWSHRAMYGFGIGDVVKEGDATASSGWTEECLKEHPEWDLSLPVGFEAKTIDDAKRMAIAFAESVS